MYYTSKVKKSGNSLMVKVRSKDGFKLGQEVFVSFAPVAIAAPVAACAGKPAVVAAENTAAKEEPEQAFIIKWQSAQNESEKNFLRLKAGMVWSPVDVARLIGIAEGKPAKLVF